MGGNSQVPFDVLYNENKELPAMYCEDSGLSASVQHTNSTGKPRKDAQERRSSLACFRSIPYDLWPKCTLAKKSVGDGFYTQKAQWMFDTAFVGGQNRPLGCPDSTRIYQDALDQRWREFNSNTSNTTLKSFRKSFTQFIRGSYA